MPYVESQLYCRLYFLDVLPASTGRAQKILAQFRVIDRYCPADLDQQRKKSGKIPCSLSSIAPRGDSSFRGMCRMAINCTRHEGERKGNRTRGPNAALGPQPSSAAAGAFIEKQAGAGRAWFQILRLAQ